MSHPGHRYTYHEQRRDENERDDRERERHRLERHWPAPVPTPLPADIVEAREAGARAYAAGAKRWSPYERYDLDRAWVGAWDEAEFQATRWRPSDD